MEVGSPWARGLQPQLHPKAEEHPQAYQLATQPRAPRAQPPTIAPVTLRPEPQWSKINKPPKQRKKKKKWEVGGDPKLRKRRGEGTKRNATLQERHSTPRHANKASSTTQTQRRHVACACTKATYRWTGICPSCSRTMVNATNANIVMQQRYRRLTRHQRMPKTPETIAPSR